MLPDLFRLIGSDRYLAPEEVDRAAEPHSLTLQAWDVYRTHFQSFTGATLDPQFHRLVHPATQVGRLRLEPGTSVLVIGTAPSMRGELDAVLRIRDRVRIITSPRGAEMLRGRGIVPDLVLVEERREVASPGSREVLAKCPLVAADWRTPSALLAPLSTSSLFVPAPSLTWGLWQATAVAIAAEAHASRIALLGFDAKAPLTALLELLARLSPFTALDCDATPKRGWVGAAVEECAGTELTAPMTVTTWEAPSMGARAGQLNTELIELAPVIDRARQVLTSAASFDRAIDEVLSWRNQPRVRVLLQESLGVSLLPRLWRLGLEQSAGRSRRVRLALSELVGQADALGAAVNEAAAA
jgi:hypothetical protein